MNTRLCQIVAIEKGEKASVNKETAPIFQAAKMPTLFSGLTKTYDPRDEDGAQYPEETSKVQHTVVDLLEAFVKPSARLLDVIATKETANTKAFADVVVDGTTVIECVPVSFLLQLEKYLQQEVRGLVVSLPTLDTAQDWEPDTSGDRGVYVTKQTTRTKTKKVNKPITLAPATDRHPAQVQMVTEDIVEGYWHEKRFSGAISGQRKQELLDRVDKLINAVKFAREEANSTTVEDKAVGGSTFRYLFS